MKALIAEYTVFNESDLAPEGACMLKTLSESFLRLGYEVVSPKKIDDFGEELKRLSPDCDVGLVIAPDDILSRFIKIIEDNTRNIGCGSLNIALCSNKRRTGAILSSNGIDVPKEINEGIRLIKKIEGVDSQNMRLSDEPLGEGEFGQEFILNLIKMMPFIGKSIEMGAKSTYYGGTIPGTELFESTGTILKAAGEGDVAKMLEGLHKLIMTSAPIPAVAIKRGLKFSETGELADLIGYKK